MTETPQGPDAPLPQWPAGAPLDPVRRLRVLAAGVSGARVTVREIAAPCADVAPLLADVDGELARLVPDMRRLRLTRAEGDRVEAQARSRFGMRARFHGVRRPGWLWLQSRFVLIGIAAAPAPDRPGHTLVAFTGGVRVPGRAALVPVGVGRAGRGVLARLAVRVERGPTSGHG
ncbi:hypothetical protein MHW47_16580 [Streptomyces sp. OfavH-34-F]|uniref:hypothetical protein n=1 Tax=Streptomyces sp. OfavH-34-F TaxID=2917760 RepID=UPI001EF2435E|nr:hypothetical protein [Streptomyces sp. OfavH-34-F]MCG7526052.1 hypothetical protein [Streptomyces sp. OfavH-34-F]